MLADATMGSAVEGWRGTVGALPETIIPADLVRLAAVGPAAVLNPWILKCADGRATQPWDHGTQRHKVQDTELSCLLFPSLGWVLMGMIPNFPTA